MMKVRHGEAYESGLVSIGFWGGVTLGQVVLGIVTEFIATLPSPSPPAPFLPPSAQTTSAKI